MGEHGLGVVGRGAGGGHARAEKARSKPTPTPRFTATPPTRGMGQDEVHLQLPELLSGQANVLEAPKAGVDTVHDLRTRTRTRHATTVKPVANGRSTVSPAQRARSACGCTLAQCTILFTNSGGGVWAGPATSAHLPAVDGSSDNRPAQLHPPPRRVGQYARHKRRRRHLIGIDAGRW
jgi:hypothetical protein